MGMQKTIGKPVSAPKGTNVYTGEEIIVEFLPLEEDRGVIFDINGREIKTDIINAELSETAVFLSGNGVKIGIIEHFLPSIYALEIDNLLVRINFKQEPYALPTFEEGSGVIFKTLKSAGITEQKKAKKYLTVDKEYFFRHDNPEKKDSISIFPGDKFSIEYRVFFPHKAVGEQIYEFEVSEHNFCSEIMDARSPAFKDRSYKYTDNIDGKFNLLIGDIDDEKYLNEPRYNGQEFARHKILDFFGTLALLGKQFKNTKFKVNMSGHEFDLKTLKEMKNNFIEI